MRTRKRDPDAKYRKLLEPLAEQFVRATPERRRQAVADMLPRSAPIPLRLLAELLIARLDDEDAEVREGSADTLALLGPHVLPTIRWAFTAKPTERRLVHLARVVARIGADLSEKGRTALLETLLIAERLSPTPESHAAMWAAIWSLREQQFEGHEAEIDEARKREAEEEPVLLARNGA